MKKFKLLYLLPIAGMIFTGCDLFKKEEPEQQETPKDFTGLVFEDAAYEYDGTAKSIAVTGLPEGATVSYGETGNSFTVPGVYPITATVSAAGYNNKSLSATLTINKGNFKDLELKNTQVAYSGEKQTITLTGEKPDSATFNYVSGFDGATEVGVHTVKGKVTADYYNDLDLEAKLTIHRGNAADALQIEDFEGYASSGALADEMSFEVYDNGWNEPTAPAAIALGVNQYFAGGTKTLEMANIKHGYAYKTEIDVDTDFRRYTGFSLDTLVEDNWPGGVKLEFQLWYKDIPLPAEYAGFSEVYITYTLDNNLPNAWTHWEVPFTNPNFRIHGGAIANDKLAEFGYNSVADLSYYLEKVAIIATPNPNTSYGSCNFFADNIKLIVTEDEICDVVLPSARYASIINNRYYQLDISNDFTQAKLVRDGVELGALDVEVDQTKVTFKDSATTGQVFTAVASKGRSSFTFSSVTGSAAENYAELVDAEFVKHASLNFDFQNATKDDSGKLNEDHIKCESAGTTSWEDKGKQIYLKEDGPADPTGGKYGSWYAGWKMTLRYTYDLREFAGLANNFSLDLKNNYGTATKKLLKIRVVDSSNADHYIVGSSASDGWEEVPAGIGWTHQNFNFDTIDAKLLVITVKNESEANDYIYFDNIKLSYNFSPETPSKVVSNGKYYIWNGDSEQFVMNVSDFLSKAQFEKLGDLTSKTEMIMTVSGEEVVLKDKAYSGAGITINGSIIANNQIKITAVTGAAASVYSGSLLNKTLKHCEDLSIDFSDGAGSGAYSNSHWSAQRWDETWSDITASSFMNSRKDDNGNKVINLKVTTNPTNFIYTPDFPIGPVNHITFDMANYYSGSAGNIKVKVAVIDGGGNKKYALGDASNYVTINKDTSHGNTLVHYDEGISLCAGAKLQVTVQAVSGDSYLYLDNFHVFYQAS